MTRTRLATGLASFGAGLNFLIASLHFSRYAFVVAQGTTPESQAMLSTLWIASGISGLIAGLIAVAATPLFVVRRRAFLWLAAAIPLSIAICQVIFLGFLVPTAFLLVISLVLIVAGELGKEAQPRPVPVPVA